MPVTLRASFADRTLAWISPWGCKKLISAPFIFYPQRFFEVSQSQVASSFPSGHRAAFPWGAGGHPGAGGGGLWGWEARACQEEETSTPWLSTFHVGASNPTSKTWI